MPAAGTIFSLFSVSVIFCTKFRFSLSSMLLLLHALNVAEVFLTGVDERNQGHSQAWAAG